jgi:outer membrane lipoprotein-sorting protein
MEHLTVSEIAPYVAIGIIMLVQSHFVVTPDQLEKTHREILEEISEKYASIQSFSLIEQQISQINETITKIYDKICK